MTAPKPDLSLEVNVTGALTKLSAILKATLDLSPVFAGPINKSVDTVFRRMFDSEGAFGGQKWAPLAPATERIRSGRGRGRGGIGRDTNRMWASLTKLGLGPDAIKVVTPFSLERGTNVQNNGFPYAVAFSKGYMSKTFPVFDAAGQPVFLHRKMPKRIPARPLVPDPVPPEIVRTWERVIRNFVLEGKTA